uniref:Glycosyltransferase family 92 protein n=1 Tax=Scylla olivacea TaxID=85551 RepID=A0A0P4W3M0_SCYOL
MKMFGSSVMVRWMVVVIGVFMLVLVIQPFIVLLDLRRSSYFVAFTGDSTTVPPWGCKCPIAWHVPDNEMSFMNLSVPWTNATIRQGLEERHPNMPVELLYGAGASASKLRCPLLPTVVSIDWRNTLWQRATLDINDKFLLYSAFLDPEADGRASIRLLGVSRSKAPPLAWCHIWFSSEAPPLSVRVTSVDYLDYQNKNSDRQMPYLLRCPLPPDTLAVPLAVSLVSEPCAPATNLLKVIGARERHLSAYRSRVAPRNPVTLVQGWAAAVCGPALFYYHEDFSQRLVEWLELLRAQGFSQVFLYTTDVHPNITKVLRHYTQEGFVQVTDYTYPPPYVNEPSLRKLWTQNERQKMFAQENVHFTDCVLRHMHQYRFLAHFDPDEVPILPHHDNFTHFLDDLMASIRGAAPAGFRLQWSYFYNNIGPSKETANLPDALWALRHTHRQAEHMKRPVPGKFKPIFDMNAVRGAYSHGPMLCTGGRCNHHALRTVSPEKEAFLAHFRLDCDEVCKQSLVSDLTLLRYSEVTTRALKVMTMLNLM